MKRLSTILILMLGVLGVKAATLPVGNQTRSYIVYRPVNMPSKSPLLISCHGMNQDAHYQKDMLKIESVADTAKFLTVTHRGQDTL